MGPADAHHYSDGVTLARANDAMTSDWFWAVVHLLGAFASFLGHVSAWSQACACHPRSLCIHLDLVAQQHQCPMRGRRGPELACGGIQRFIDELETTTSVELQAKLDGLNSGARGIVLRDFEIGKAFLQTELALRTQCWSKLPLKLFCLGHWDLEVVRQNLAQCLVLYANLPACSAHRWTEEVLSPAGALRAICEGIVERALPFDDWGELAHHRARAQFAPTLEISIERKHAQLHHHIRLAPRHGGSFASVFLRKAEVMRGLERQQETSQKDLAALLQACCSPSAVVAQLGLVMHPSFAPFVEDDPSGSRIPHTMVVRVVYRCDVYTQFMPLGDVREGRGPGLRGSSKSLNPPNLEEDPFMIEAGSQGGLPESCAVPVGSGVGDSLDAFGNEPLDADAPVSGPHSHVAVGSLPQEPQPTVASLHSASASSSSTAEQPKTSSAQSTVAQAVPPGMLQGRKPESAASAATPAATAAEAATAAKCRIQDWPQALSIALESACAQHLRKTADEHLVLSVKLPEGSLLSVGAQLQPQTRCPPDLLAKFVDSGIDMAALASGVNLELLGIELDAGVGDQLAASRACAQKTHPTAGGLTFFRMLLRNPADVRVGRADGAATFSSSDIVVSSLTVDTIDSSAKAAFVRHSGNASDALVLSNALLASCADTVYAWTSDMAAFFRVPTAVLPTTPFLCEVLQSLSVACGSESSLRRGLTIASGPGVAGVDARVLSMLRQLESSGVVECTSDLGDASTWVLTEEGREMLTPVTRVHSPKRFLALRQGTGLHDLSELELVQHLLKHGWEAKVWTERHLPPAIDVAKACPKVFYVKPKSVTLKRLYLLACASLSDLKDTVALMHFQNDSYYKSALVGGAFVVESDVGIDIAGPQQQTRRRNQVGSSGRVVANRKKLGFKGRTVHEKSFFHGPAWLTYMEKQRAWQAQCPRTCSHISKAKSVTRCKKRLSFRTLEEEVDVVRRLKHWVNSCLKYDTRLAHQGYLAPLRDVPDDDVLAAECLAADYNSGDEKGAKQTHKRRRRKGSKAAQTEADASALKKRKARPIAICSSSPCHETSKAAVCRVAGERSRLSDRCHTESQLAVVEAGLALECACWHRRLRAQWCLGHCALAAYTKSRPCIFIFSLPPCLFFACVVLASGGQCSSGRAEGRPSRQKSGHRRRL